MRKLTQNDIYHISGGSLSGDVDYFDFEQKYTNLGYKVGRGWDAYLEAVNKYGSDNVPHVRVPDGSSREPVIFAIHP